MMEARTIAPRHGTPADCRSCLPLDKTPSISVGAAGRVIDDTGLAQADDIRQAMGASTRDWTSCPLTGRPGPRRGGARGDHGSRCGGGDSDRERVPGTPDHEPAHVKAVPLLDVVRQAVGIITVYNLSNLDVANLDATSRS